MFKARDEEGGVRGKRCRLGWARKEPRAIQFMGVRTYILYQDSGSLPEQSGNQKGTKRDGARQRVKPVTDAHGDGRVVHAKNKGETRVGS